MNDWLPQLVLFAETERARAFSETFRGERSEPEVGGFLLIVAGIGLLLLVSWSIARLIPRQQRPKASDNPRGLFKSLCRAHGLDGASRRALWKLAQQYHAGHPAVLFTTPEALESRLASSRSARDVAMYQRLREQLFGAAAESTGEPSSS
jgi:hypothetical protein